MESAAGFGRSERLKGMRDHQDSNRIAEAARPMLKAGTLGWAERRGRQPVEPVEKVDPFCSHR
jgi:hypothetical protein